MPESPVTELLIDWGKGDRSALDRLMPLVYAELHNVARRQLGYENPGHTLQPTALVHETYLRLVDQERMDWRNRASKRGGAAERVELDTQAVASGLDTVDVLALDDAMGALAVLDAQQAKVIELRFYTGLSIEETAAALGVSPATVNRDWVTAKAWLYRKLKSPTT